MEVVIYNRSQLERRGLEKPAHLISMHDPELPPAAVPDAHNLLSRLDLTFHDVEDYIPGLAACTSEDARRIFKMVAELSVHEKLAVQCEAGAGRSAAVVAALQKMTGGDNAGIVMHGTYNRRLYKLILAQAGITVPPEPLVSIACRVKYPADRLQALILSMRRQRHKNWELVAVTDGPRPDVEEMRMMMGDKNVHVIQTPAPLGRWGHPYRQLGIDACQGDFIGLTNDDNYYVPGYLEQMLYFMGGRDMILCHYLHSNKGWDIVLTEPKVDSADLGCFIAKANLVKSIPWTGQDFTSDGTYIEALAKAAKGGIAILKKPMFIHN